MSSVQTLEEFRWAQCNYLHWNLTRTFFQGKKENLNWKQDISFTFHSKWNSCDHTPVIASRNRRGFYSHYWNQSRLRAPSGPVLQTHGHEHPANTTARGADSQTGPSLHGLAGPARSTCRWDMGLSSVYNRSRRGSSTLGWKCCNGNKWWWVSSNRGTGTGKGYAISILGDDGRQHRALSRLMLALVWPEVEPQAHRGLFWPQILPPALRCDPRRAMRSFQLEDQTQYWSMVQRGLGSHKGNGRGC